MNHITHHVDIYPRGALWAFRCSCGNVFAIGTLNAMALQSEEHLAATLSDITVTIARHA